MSGKHLRVLVFARPSMGCLEGVVESFTVMLKEIEVPPRFGARHFVRFAEQPVRRILDRWAIADGRWGFWMRSYCFAQGAFQTSIALAADGRHG